MPASTFLFYRTGFAPTNGTSVQLKRLIGNSEDCFVHLLWDAQEAGTQSVPWAFNTDDHLGWKWPFGRVARCYQYLRSLTLQPWWKGCSLNTKRLHKSLSTIPLRPSQAYAVCYKEDDAAKIVALWDAVGRPPLVLHIMDILNDGLSQAKAPNFALLARAASHVLCLNRVIENEVKALGPIETSIFPLCSDLAFERRLSTPRFPLKVIISGSLYADLAADNKAMHLLCDGWPMLEKAFPGIELHYAGSSGAMLPSYLRDRVQDHGLLPPIGPYQDLLATCHVAYVPVSHGNNTPLRFSMPSRIPDYLISGVPTIACTQSGTGIYEFFQTTPPECTQLVDTPEELLASVQRFAGDAAKWKQASDSAVDFSKRAFSVETARETLFGYLDAAKASSLVGV